MNYLFEAFKTSSTSKSTSSSTSKSSSTTTQPKKTTTTQPATTTTKATKTVSQPETTTTQSVRTTTQPVTTTIQPVTTTTQPVTTTTQPKKITTTQPATTTTQSATTTTQPKKSESFSLDGSYFDKNTYYSIFCHKDKFERFNDTAFDTTSQKIIKKERKSSYRTCEDSCQKDKECTSYTFNDSIDECITFKSYPKNIIKNRKSNICGIKNSSSYDFSKLNSNQKKNVRNYCIQNYYEKKNLKSNIEKCIRDVYKKKNNSYIDLDVDCVADKVRINKTKDDIKKEKINIQLKSESPTLQRYLDNWKSFQSSMKKYNQTENQVKIYDPKFTSFQESQQKNIQELQKDMNQSISTIENNEKQLEQEKQNVIGETFQNYLSSTNQQKYTQLFIYFIFILILLIVILYHYKK